MEFYGIDVSKYQGNINWTKVKTAGKQFAILKATKKDNNIEESFARNYNGCISSGIPVGVYRYVYAKNVTEAKTEAVNLAKVIKDKKIPWGVWLDMEDASIRKLGKDELTKIINAEADIIKQYGFNVGIYCNQDWYKNVIDGTGLSKKYKFWIAKYPSGDNGTLKESLSPKSYAQAWQYSSKGQVAGISGYVDLNVAYEDLSKTMKVTTTTSSTSTSSTKDTSFKVKIIANSLIIRKSSSILSSKVGYIHKNEVYTIVETSGTWGKLKSGVGWISIKPEYVKKL